MAESAGPTGQGDKVEVPGWAFEFQGHRCMCMPLGYRAGLYAMKVLGIEREKDYGTFLFSELSDEDSSGCFDDGAQAATGCTVGKDLFTRLGYGKLAIILYKPGEGAVRVHVRNDFLDRLTRGVGRGFLETRAKGLQPSQMPREVIDPVIEWIETRSDEEMFEYELLAGFKYAPKRKGMIRRRCDSCGEYTFEADGKVVGDKFYCRPCYYGAKAQGQG